jgi:hypothetical protein
MVRLLVRTHPRHLALPALLAALSLAPLRAAAPAAELPYAVFAGMLKAGELMPAADGWTFDLRVKAKNPAETRPIELRVQGGPADLRIPVASNGTFQLPLLPESIAGRATVSHNLEPGALELSFGLAYRGEIEASSAAGVEVGRVLTEFSIGLRKLKGLWPAMCQAAPELRPLWVVCTGVVFQDLSRSAGPLTLAVGTRKQPFPPDRWGRYTVSFDQHDPRNARLLTQQPNAHLKFSTEALFLTGTGRMPSHTNYVIVKEPDPGRSPARR